MLTIAWDIDDVLNALTYEWLCDYNATQSDSIPYSDLKKNPPHPYLSISKQEYLASLDRFRLSDNFLSLSPNSEIMNWFKVYGDRAHHIALTAVPRRTAHQSAQWLIHNFGDWIRTFHFVPSKRDGETIPQYDNNKGEYLERVAHCDILIEDSPANVQLANEAGLDTFLVKQPWNSGLPVSSILEILTEKVEEHS